MATLGRAEYEQRLRDLGLLITDVDGVLTDGSIAYVGADSEAKIFHVRDGSAVYIADLIGLPIFVLTARTSDAVARRFAELPVLELRQGTFDKLSVCLELQERLDLDPSRIAYIGDDLVDLPSLRHVGLGITVVDAHPRVLAEADWHTERGGGQGALREVIDDVVTARGLWDRVLADYQQRQGSADSSPERSETGD